MAFPAIAIGGDWSHVDFMNAHLQAVRDRGGVLTAGLYPMEAGDDVQGRSPSFFNLFESMQKGIVGLVTTTPARWLTNTLDDYNDETAIVIITTASQLWALAGMNAGGFRRIVEGDDEPTDWEDEDDDAYSYGYAEESDVIGPWLFADIQACCNQLTRTHRHDTYVDEHNGDIYHGEGYGEATWAAAKTAAEDDIEADYDTNGPDFCRSSAGMYVSSSSDYDAWTAARLRHVVWKDFGSGSRDIQRVCKAYVVPITFNTLYGSGGVWSDQRSERDDGTNDPIVKDVYNVLLTETHVDNTIEYESGIGQPYNGYESDRRLDDQQSLSVVPIWRSDVTPADPGIEYLGWMDREDILTTYDWAYDDQ